MVYPEVRFLYRAAKDGSVTGTFAMHGIERELTVPLKSISCFSRKRPLILKEAHPERFSCGRLGIKN